jgi:hypothetical protein
MNIWKCQFCFINPPSFFRTVVCPKYVHSMFLQITNNRPFLNQRLFHKETQTLPGLWCCQSPGFPIPQLLPLLLMFSFQVAKTPWYLKNANRSGKTQDLWKTPILNVPVISRHCGLVDCACTVVANYTKGQFLGALLMF